MVNQRDNQPPSKQQPREPSLVALRSRVRALRSELARRAPEDERPGAGVDLAEILSGRVLFAAPEDPARAATEGDPS